MPRAAVLAWIPTGDGTPAAVNLAGIKTWIGRQATRCRDALLLTPLLLWVAADAIVPNLGFARDAMRVAVDIADCRWPHWSLLPVAAVLLVAVRGGLTAGSGNGRWRAAWLGVGNVLRWLALPILLLLALRALSLWQAAGVALPWIGLTWSPHASVALAVVPFLGRRERPAAIRRRMAVLLFVGFLALYGGYALYICQMVMIHGDEAQYLRVTQSLLRDGDINLANNLDGDVTEFHVMDVGADKAPKAPPGKVYSVHPVGLSVLLLPTYELGLQLWSNPRLGTSLFMAMCAAAVVALLYLWLCHVGMAHSLALWVSLACATTTPLLLFSTQIYPELPTLLVTLIVLLRLDARLLLPPTDISSPRRGAQGPWELGALALLVGLLPFLHPRYAPLAALLAAGLLWQARGRRLRQGFVVAAGGICLVILLLHNYDFSGDWLGNFRPGNSWDEDAVSPATWWMSLPGQWLHVSKGLALNAPWFFIAVIPGITALVMQRDRRLLAAVLLYTTTAVVNGIHPDWTFGFCLPARFLVTALPALALCAACGLDVIRRSPWLGVLFCGALAVSWDVVGAAIHIPELAFEGEHLPRTVVAGFYPFGVHGFLHTVASPPVPDLLLWSAAAAALICATIVTIAGITIARPALRWRWISAGAILLALLAPALWGLAGTSVSRLNMSLSPYLKTLTDGQIGDDGTLYSTFRRLREGDRLADGSFAADASSPGGALAAYYMPIQLPGVYRIVTENVAVDGEQTAYISHQRTLPALQPWVERLRFPMHGELDGTQRFDYYHDRLQLGYLHFVYSGSGTLRLGETTQIFHARRLPLRLEEAARVDFRDASPPYSAREDLQQGRYLARFHLTGGALSTLTQRQPTPVKMAVFVADGTPIPFHDLLPWYSSQRRWHDIISQPQDVQPQRELLAAPWWASVPIAGDQVFELSFLVRQPGPVWILFQYDGPADLSLAEIVVYRQHLDME